MAKAKAGTDTALASCSYKEAAARIGCSVRTIHRLRAQGHLRRAWLPARVRAFGVVAVDVAAVIDGIIQRKLEEGA